MRQCLGCSTPFNRGRGAYRYCSDECKLKIDGKDCAVCGTRFVPRRDEQTRCSSRCRGLAQRAAALSRKAKVCLGCKAELPLDRFWKSSDRSDGLAVRCIDCVTAYARGYRRKNPDYWRPKSAGALATQRAAFNTRRARKAGALGTLTPADWNGIVLRQRGECFYCGADRPLTQEHLTPLSRGGSHSVGNVVGACLHCNCQKRSRTVMEYRLWLLRRRAAVAA